MTKLLDLPRLGAALVCFSLLGGCAVTETVEGYLGTADHEDENVEGDRIAVLSLDENLVADPRISGLQVNLPRPYTNNQWPQPGGSPTNSMQHLQLEGELDRVWSRSAGSGNSLSTRMTATPIIANDKIFLLDAEAQVYALEAETGERLWRERVRRRGEGRREGFGGGIAHAADRVIVTTGYGDVYALNEETGEEIWTRDVGVPIRTAPTVIQGRAFLVTTDNQLLALDTQSGEILWNYRAFQESAGILAPTSPAANSDVVIAPFSSGELGALRIRTGSVAWTDQLTRTGSFTPLANINAIAARPVISGGRVYAVSHSGRFVAIDLRTGERIWSVNIASTQTPWIAGEFAYLVSVDAELICISLRDGRIRWITQMDRWRRERAERGAIQYVGPVLISERLVVISSEGRLHQYSPFDGSFIDDQRVGDPVSLPPIVANNTLYVYSDDADLIAFRGEEPRPNRNVRNNVNARATQASSSSQDAPDAESSDEEEGGGGWLRWPWSSQ